MRMRRVQLCFGAAFVVTAVASCAETAREETKPISTGLLSLESEVPPTSATVDRETQARLDLMAQAQQNSQISVDSPPTRPGRTRSNRAESSAGAAVEESPAEVTPEPTAEPSEAAGPGPVAASREALVAELAAQLREQSRSSSAPAASLLRLAALELIESKAGEADAAAEAALTPQESEFLRAWREMFAAARDGLSSSGDLAPLAAQMVSLAERVQAAQPLSVLESRLCTRVEGFGMFDELKRRDGGGPYVFVAGKRQRAIVYVELANFTHEARTQGGVNGFEVRLAQELELFHSSAESDTVVWRRPFQEINDFSRKRRRDFYTTQVIDLPANLGVGSYRLKVSMSDRATGAVAEAVVPMEFVAEPPRK
ncbi:MAG: hypothetical protein JNK58_06990 [Phycisphaerae bacterium]|nr:hypothetical protein [Phycisphaerae bacterium]